MSEIGDINGEMLGYKLIWHNGTDLRQDKPFVVDVAGRETLP